MSIKIFIYIYNIILYFINYYNCLYRILYPVGTSVHLFFSLVCETA